MTLFDGRAHTRWGSAGMLNTKAAFCLLGVVLFFGVVALIEAQPVR